jgi:Spy/CpxP family protein refolding chaperone
MPFMRACRAAFVIALAFAGSAASAQQHGNSPYTGAEQRQIASLSANDLADLRSGQGWGLALPAELNGVPGPTHLLELSEDIGLSKTQIAELTDIRDRMRAAAIEAGEVFIASERALNDAFVDGAPDETTMARLVQVAGNARAALRLAHLSAHLETLPLLTTEQVASYNRLRGYHEATDCEKVPEGHDPAMWHQHKGCE